MGGDQADRTLYVGNLHPRTTEELLYELFLQAGPAFNVKIPKDKDGNPKQFAFVNFKHEESVPYGMNLLNGIKLFGRPLKIQYRSGSTHVSQDTNQSPQGNSGNGQASNDSSGHSPVPNYQRSYSSPDNLQRQAVMNNFYKQETPLGSRAHLMVQQPSPPSASYTPNSSRYSPSGNHPTPHRYDSLPGQRNSRNHASHPYKNENYNSRDMYNRVAQEEHYYRSQGQEEHRHRSHGHEEHHYRSRGHEKLSPDPRNDPRWGSPHH
ncbi:RNA-binding protein 7 [Mantella aurantiaca]